MSTAMRLKVSMTLKEGGVVSGWSIHQQSHRLRSWIQIKIRGEVSNHQLIGRVKIWSKSFRVKYLKHLIFLLMRQKGANHTIFIKIRLISIKSSKKIQCMNKEIKIKKTTYQEIKIKTCTNQVWVSFISQRLVTRSNLFKTSFLNQTPLICFQTQSRPSSLQ